MTLRLNGSTSGYTEIDAPAVAGSNTLVLPTGNGTADQALVTNGSGTLSWADRGRMVLDTAKASSSGTSVDFTGVPSWAKKISVTFTDVGTNGTSQFLVQVGTGGSFVTSSYVSSSSLQYGTNLVSQASYTTGFGIYSNQASDVIFGTLVIQLHQIYVYVASGTFAIAGRTGIASSAGRTTNIAGAIDRIRITTVNGTDAFDGGNINILYEG
jgi:hypothetical protein